MSNTWGWQVEPCRNGRDFILASEYLHQVTITPRRHRLPEVEKLLEKHAGSYEIHVPGGFEFDGSSTPKVFWSLAPPMTGKHTHASLLHDWLYVDKRIWSQIADSDQFGSKPCSRELADLIFLQVMYEDGVERDLAETMWGAVKNHGWRAWRD